MGKNQKIKKAKKVAVAAELKLDLGCGKNPREGFAGVDIRDFGQKYTADLTKKWPWKDGSVSEVHCSHFVEHLEPEERIHFANELYRVLKDDAAATIVTPHWCSSRAYGDMTHKWPPVSEFWFYYLKVDWRKDNAPHNDGYTCNFEVTWGHSLHQGIQGRNQEFITEKLMWAKEAALDTIATFKKLPMPK